MHRQISHADQTFYQERNLSLYCLTGLLGLLIGIDLWPDLVAWTGLHLPTWESQAIFGYRIALIAAVLGGARVLFISLEGLLEGRIGADLALGIACIAAILFNRPMVAAEIVFIGMLGECLESFTFERTQRAIRTIVEVCPQRCWLLKDGQEVRVLTCEVQVGDRVIVKPGARVPVDGVILEGHSTLDTSPLTGESLPVERSQGDEVLAGSINQLGALTVEAQRVAEQTVVGQVIELTTQSLHNKATLERTADRLAAFFLPAILGLAGLTFVVSVFIHLKGQGAGTRGLFEAARLSLDPTLAVLVVACPCALILATPAAVIAALGRLAGTGVLIKGGSSLERLAEVTAMAFDKTGTLTEGRMELGEILGLNGITAEELLAVAASAEQFSEHPLGQVITKEARARGIMPEPAKEFVAHPGGGVSALVVRSEVSFRVMVGNRRFLEEKKIAIPPETLTLLDRLDHEGQTVLLVVRQEVILGAIGARDRIRPEAEAVIAELKSMGIDIALLTGDRQAAARTVGESLDISRIGAELLPQEKASFIEQWKHEGQEENASAFDEGKNQIIGGRLRGHRLQPFLRRVAMVGDGINDAPALACADVGLAIGTAGNDVAAQVGDVILMGDPLRPLPLLVKLSQATVRIIRQNILIFAFGVNAVGILITAWLWPVLTPLSWHNQAPVAAVIYHQIGSLAVLLNAMRLLWFERTATNPTWLRMRRAIHAFDHWIEHSLDFGEAVHWIEHHWRLLARLATIFGIAAYCLSGLARVGADEVGVVCRFGRPVGQVLDPGLYWRWPWPVEKLIRVKPDHVFTVEIGFRSENGISPLASNLEWTSSHPGQVAFLDESEMITGDGNLVEVQVMVRYRINRQKLNTFLFDIGNPDDVVRALAESVLRETIASRHFNTMATLEREKLQEELLAQIKQRSKEYGSHAAWMHLEGISLIDLHPPAKVVPAYYDVTKAMQDRDRQINEALAQAKQEKAKEEVQAKQTIAIAQAEKSGTLLLAEADRGAFLARWHARAQIPLTEEWQLFRDTYERIRAGQSPESAYQELDRSRRAAETQMAVLNDFRLFWDALADALKGRDTIILDADKVPGRRHLFLFDLNQGRVPLPAMVLPSRDPAMPAQKP